MKKSWLTILTVVISSILIFSQSPSIKKTENVSSNNVYPIQQGFVDANGVMIYYEEFGKGKPLMAVAVLESVWRGDALGGAGYRPASRHREPRRGGCGW